MNNLFTQLSDRPEVGSATSIISFITGFLPGWFSVNKDDIIFCFQIAAFTVSILAGIATIISQHKKWKKRK